MDATNTFRGDAVDQGPGGHARVALEGRRRSWDRVQAGVFGPLLFVAVSYLQMPANPGLDLSRHAFSYLSIGPTGVVQQVNFVALGVLNVIAATGLRRHVAGRTGVVAAVALAVCGLGQMIAGVFTLDPSNGFPAGAPAGMPPTVSTHGNLHGLGFTVAMVAWVVLLCLLARWQARQGDKNWARADLFFAVALVVTAACLMTPFGTVLLYVVLTSAWLHTAALLRHISHSLPAPAARDAGVEQGRAR